jgi:hypothetical protein
MEGQGATIGIARAKEEGETGAQGTQGDLRQRRSRVDHGAGHQYSCL